MPNINLSNPHEGACEPPDENCTCPTCQRDGNRYYGRRDGFAGDMSADDALSEWSSDFR